MIEVSTRANDDGTMDERELASDLDGITTIEAYETEEGVVFYDADNPLAWVEATRTLSLEECA